MKKLRGMIPLTPNHVQYTKKLLRISNVQPLKMLILLPTITLLSLYMATMYGYQYLMLATFPRVFEGTYGYSKSGVGLVYLRIGVGFLFALVLSAMLSDRLAKQLTKRYGGDAKPEYRLPLLFVGAALTPIGLFLYGLTATKNIHWIVPIIGFEFLGATSFTIIVSHLLTKIKAQLTDLFTRCRHWHISWMLTPPMPPQRPQRLLFPALSWRHCFLWQETVCTTLLGSDGAHRFSVSLRCLLLPFL